MNRTKITQIIPLPESKTIITADESGKHNINRYIVGAALMEDGKVLPLVWDGRFSFDAFDPLKEQFSEFMKRLLQEPTTPTMPRYAKDYAKKMAALNRINGREGESNAAIHKA